MWWLFHLQRWIELLAGDVTDAVAGQCGRLGDAEVEVELVILAHPADRCLIGTADGVVGVEVDLLILAHGASCDQRRRTGLYNVHLHHHILLSYGYHTEQYPFSKMLYHWHQC